MEEGSSLLKSFLFLSACAKREGWSFLGDGGKQIKDKQIPSTTFCGLVVKQLVKFKEFLNKSSIIDVSVAALLIYNYS